MPAATSLARLSQSALNQMSVPVLQHMRYGPAAQGRVATCVWDGKKGGWHVELHPPTKYLMPQLPGPIRVFFFRKSALAQECCRAWVTHGYVMHVHRSYQTGTREQGLAG